MESEENIGLAYRNIKRNTESKTAGVDGLTIKDIQGLTDKFIAQYGKCYITKQELGKYDWHCHHKTPKRLESSDNYQNLVILHENVHKLIHMTDEMKIRENLKLFQIKGNSLERLNELRKQAQISVIG